MAEQISETVSILAKTVLRSTRIGVRRRTFQTESPVLTSASVIALICMIHYVNAAVRLVFLFFGNTTLFAQSEQRSMARTRSQSYQEYAPFVLLEQP